MKHQKASGPLLVIESPTNDLRYCTSRKAKHSSMNIPWHSYPRDNTHRTIVKHPFSRSMDHSTHASEMKKRPTPEEGFIPRTPYSSTISPHQSISYGVNYYPKAVRRVDGASKSRSPHRHIDKSHYWKPLIHPPSPPQEEAVMTSLPSFSTLSDIAGTGVGNHDHKAPIQSPKKSNSLNSFHYPPTPPLSLSSRSLSGRSSSPLMSAPRAFLEPPTQAPAPTPMYYFTGANTETKPPSLHLQSPAVLSELERVVPFTKRHCVRSSPEALQPDYPNQQRQANELQRPPQAALAPPDAIYPATKSAAQQPINTVNPFYTTMASPIGFEHHHYISPSSASYPLQQERYNCPDCGRAFSRPSSLKIHTYSHTGEKPFYCPVRGCNKNFSVRSNMKRHERGCHARKK